MAANLVRLPFAREGQIAALAGQLTGTRFPAGRVEPEQIATNEGIAFRYAPFPEEFDGILLHEAGRFFIVCNDRVSARGSPRSRFTFAHELGHYFLADHRRALVAGDWPTHYSRVEFRSESPVEMEADLFASNLLLPAASFRAAAAAQPGPGLARIAALAATFGTSVTATAYRALGLELFPAPAAVFRWNQLGAPAGRRMSDATARLGHDYCGLAGRPPGDSATARAIAELAFDSRQGSAPAMDWFPKLSGYRPGDQRFLHEEVMSLGDHGWLTLVHREDRSQPGT